MYLIFQLIRINIIVKYVVIDVWCFLIPVTKSFTSPVANSTNEKQTIKNEHSH